MCSCFVAVPFNVLVMSLCWIARIIYVGNSLFYLVTVSWAIVLVLLSKGKPIVLKR